MTVNQFWQLIEESRQASKKGMPQVAYLEKSLRALPNNDIVGFEGNCWDLLSVCYTRELWAVATIIQPSCTLASFDAVRAWIILQGRECFETICDAPERLADRALRRRIPWAPDGEMLLRLVPRIYRHITGDELPTLPRSVPCVLKGERWVEFDLPELYPELWKKYRE